MKLTRKEIDEIYYFIGNGFSQRKTALHTKHSKQTVARYLKPEVVTEHYMDLILDDCKKEYDTQILKNEVSLYRNLAIVGFTSLITQVIINIFF